jgi:mRNA interferase MazF
MSLKNYLMKINQFDIWLADLNPSQGTEPGKTRPVVVIQTDLLNEIHPSTIICPITTNVQKDIEILRVHLKKSQLDKLSDILVDQIRAIDNKRLITKLGKLTNDQKIKLKNNIRIVLDI